MNSQIELPLPPETEDALAMDVYARFMRHLRQVPHSRVEIKVLSAIQFTANMMDYTDAQITKMLVDMGLRAGRDAFPADYLEFAYNSLMRTGWEVGGPSAGLLALQDYWDTTGEDKFAAFKRQYSLLDERTMMTTV